MKKLLLASALAALGASQAQAAVISYDYGVPIQEERTEISQSFNLDLFDSNLGTLTGVTFTALTTGTTELSLTNNAAQNQFVGARTEVNLFFTADNAILSAIFSTFNPFSNPILQLDMVAFSGALIPPGETIHSGEITGSDQITLSSNDYASLLGLQQTGGGQSLISCQSITSLIVQGGGGNVSSSQETYAGCAVTVSYQYEPASTPPDDPPTQVPEPTTLALLGLGLSIAGFSTGAMRRRKR